MEQGLENEEKPVVTPVNHRAGELVRAARLAAGVDLEKLSAALRISNAALEALEAGQYDRLPGDPYVRALLGSIARHLGIDPAKFLQAYNSEIGTKPEEAPARPYKDVSQIHLLAHKKWFIALLGVLLVALLFIFGKVNSSSDKTDMSIATTPRPDTSANLAAPADSLSENKSLAPDSLNGKLDTNSKVAAKRDTIRTVAAVKMDTAHKTVAKAHDSIAAVAKTPVSVAQAGMNRVSVKPLVDSVWMRVLRKGKPEEIILLRKDKPVDVAHTDTIVLILGKRHSVELSFGDSATAIVPAKKRFKLVGKKIIYF